MSDFDTHLCLVSDQPLPNLVPALAPEMACRRVVLLATPPMARRAQWLADVLAKRGVEAIQHEVHSDNLPVFRNAVAGLLREYPSAVLNATGGLKTMALTAFDAARAEGRGVFYVERDNRLIWLNPIDRPGMRLPGVLDIETYFAAFGQGVLECQRQPDPLDKTGFAAWATRPWSHNFHRRYYKAVAQLRQQGGDAPRPDIAKVLDLWQRMGLAKRTPAGYATGRPEAIPYLTGRWLESAVFAHLRKVLAEGSLQADIAWGVKTGPLGKEGSPNEFDVAAVVDNVLHIVECKTSLDGEVANFIYKLDSLRRKSGLTARAALVTISEVVEDGGHAERAREAGIVLASGWEQGKLENWLTQ